METYTDKLIRVREGFSLLSPFNKETAFDVVKKVLLTESNTIANREDSLMEFIFGRISDKLNIEMEDIRSRSREWEISKARHIYVSMLYIFTDMQHTEIASHVNLNNHTIVNYSRRKLTEMIEGRWNPEMNMIIDLYLEVKHIANDLGIFDGLMPSWFMPNSYKDEVLALLNIGPIKRKKSKGPKWFKSFKKYGKAL